MAQFLDPECVDELMECPLCMDPLDLTEKCFKPCPCGYQMCSFCFHRIVDSEGNKCPACRRTYNPDNYTHLQVRNQEFRGQSAKGKPKGRATGKDEPENRTSLTNIRVVQRNLVYVTNLSLDVAKEEILRKNEFFSQYGKIAKMVVNRSNVYQGSSVSCYITYSKPEEAYRCIETVDGCILNDRTLRASFGTTKYCSYFLRNRHCTNPDCMYLHEYGDEKDSFTKEDMQAGKHLARVPPPQAHHTSTRSYGLPPPRGSLRSSMTPVTKPNAPNTTTSTPVAAPSTAAAQAPPTIASAASLAPSAANLAWKTQSVGPSMAQLQLRRNDMGDATNAQKIAQNTATMMQQYEDDEEDEEYYESDEEEASEVQNHNVGLADETAFPALGKAPSPAPTPINASTSSLTSSTSLTASTKSATEAKKASSSAPSTQPTAAASTPSTTQSTAPSQATPITNTVAPITTTSTTAAAKPSATSPSQEAQAAPAVRTNNHNKSHWHAKEKPVWQPKAVQKTDSAVTSASASTAPSSTSSASSASPSNESEASSSGSDQGDSSKSAKSPWKATPTPTAVSISELHKIEEAKVAQSKVVTQPAPAPVSAKGSILPATASWASSPGKPLSPRSSSNTIEPEAAPASPTSAALSAEMEKKETPAAAPAPAPAQPPAASNTTPAAATTHQPQQQHQRSHSKHGKNKSAAAFAKVPLAPPKEPVFDIPEPVKVVQPTTEAPKTNEANKVEDEKKDVSSTSSASTDDDLPPISFVPGSSNESPEETEETIDDERAFPSFLSSAFANFGVAPTSNTSSLQDVSSITGSSTSIGRPEPSAADLSGLNDRYSLYGSASNVTGTPGNNIASGTPAVAPIGRPSGASRNGEPDLSAAASTQSSMPMSFSLLASDMWGLGTPTSQPSGAPTNQAGSAFMQPYASNASQPSWSSFGSNNLFSPYPASNPASSAPSSQLWGSEPLATGDSNSSRSRFAFASAADPPVSSSASQATQSRMAPHSNMGLMGQSQMSNSAIGALPSAGGPSTAMMGGPNMRMSHGQPGGGDMPPGLFTGNSTAPMGGQHAPMPAPMGSMGSSNPGMPNQAASAHQQQQQQMQMNFLFQQQNMKMHAMHHPHHPAHTQHHHAPHAQPQAPYGSGPGWSWFQPTQTQDWSGSSGTGGSNPSTPGLQGGQSILSVLSAGMNASNSPSPSNATQTNSQSPAPQHTQPQHHQLQQPQQTQQPPQMPQQRYPQWGMPMPHGQFMGFGDYPGFHPGPHTQPPSHMDHQQ